MFYVNDEPEGQFLHTETIKLLCIVLYCIVLQVPQFPRFRPQGEVFSPLSQHLALRGPETELPPDESRRRAPSKSLPEPRCPKKREPDAAVDALQLYVLFRERALLRSNDDSHDVPDDLDEADGVPEPFRHRVGVSQRLQRPLFVLPGAVRRVPDGREHPFRVLRVQSARRAPRQRKEEQEPHQVSVASGNVLFVPGEVQDASVG